MPDIAGRPADGGFSAYDVKSHSSYKTRDIFLRGYPRDESQGTRDVQGRPARRLETPTTPAGGGSVVEAEFASAGAANVTGVGAAVSTTVFSISGVATVSGIGTAVTATTFVSAGVGTTSGIGVAITASVFASAGVGTGSGVGGSVYAGVGASVGIGTATGQSATPFAAVFSANGIAAVSGVSGSVSGVVFSAVGVSVVSGISETTSPPVVTYITSKVRSGFTLTKGKIRRTILSEPFKVSMTETSYGPSPTSYAVSPSGTPVDFTPITTPGLAQITNLDSENYLEYGPYVAGTGTFYPVGEIGPGESYCLKFSRSLLVGATLQLRANTAAVTAVVEAYEK